MHSFLSALKKYAVADGRSTSKEFWEFMLVNFLLTIIIGIVDTVVESGGMIFVLYCLAMLCPCLALSIRRLHDTNRTGWWLLLGFIPVVGQIILIIFTIQTSTVGQNRYGPAL